MQKFKIVAAGLCSLLAVGSLFSVLGKVSNGGLNFSDNQTLISVVSLVVFGILAAYLWKDATSRRRPRG